MMLKDNKSKFKGIENEWFGWFFFPIFFLFISQIWLFIDPFSRISDGYNWIALANLLKENFPGIDLVFGSVPRDERLLYPFLVFAFVELTSLPIFVIMSAISSIAYLIFCKYVYKLGRVCNLKDDQLKSFWIISISSSSIVYLSGNTGTDMLGLMFIIASICEFKGYCNDKSLNQFFLSIMFSFLAMLTREVYAIFLIVFILIIVKNLLKLSIPFIILLFIISGILIVRTIDIFFPSLFWNISLRNLSNFLKTGEIIHLEHILESYFIPELMYQNLEAFFLFLSIFILPVIYITFITFILKREDVIVSFSSKNTDLVIIGSIYFTVIFFLQFPWLFDRYFACLIPIISLKFPEIDSRSSRFWHALNFLILLSSLSVILVRIAF